MRSALRAGGPGLERLAWRKRIRLQSLLTAAENTSKVLDNWSSGDLPRFNVGLPSVPQDLGPKPSAYLGKWVKNPPRRSSFARKKRGAIEGPIRIPLDSSLFLFNALALLSISSKSLKLQLVLFSIPTAPTNCDLIIYFASIQASDPVSLTATFVKKIRAGLPSAVPRWSVEKSRGPAFL